jgi:hypothetical protein
MKNVVPTIRAILVAYAPLMALIKSGANPPRLYLMRAEQFTSGGDCIINEISGDMSSDMQGATDPWFSRLSFECRASTYAQAVAISDAIKACLLPFRGAALDQNIQGCMHASEYSDYNDEGTVFRHIVDFRIAHGPV